MSQIIREFIRLLETSHPHHCATNSNQCYYWRDNTSKISIFYAISYPFKNRKYYFNILYSYFKKKELCDFTINIAKQNISYFKNIHILLGNGVLTFSWETNNTGRYDRLYHSFSDKYIALRDNLYTELRTRIKTNRIKNELREFYYTPGNPGYQKEFIEKYQI